MVASPEARRRSRWLLPAIAVLVAASVVVPLASGAGVAGLLAMLPLFVIATILLVVTWLLLSLWPHTRVRALNAIRALLAALLVLVAGLIYVRGSLEIAGFLGDRAELPVQDRYVCVVVCDGASLIHARELLMEGVQRVPVYSTDIESRNFPTISHYFIQNGAATANGLSVWPSSSVPAHTGIMTGCYPRHTGVMGQRQFNPARKYHVSYIGLGISMLKRMLSSDVRTLPEYFPDVRSLIVLQIANRGASLYLPTTPQDEQVIRWASRAIGATDFLGRYTGHREIPRILVMTLPDIDHQTHNASLDDARSRSIYLAQDQHLADLIGLYKRKGIYSKTLFVLCSDHGMEDVHSHLTIDNLMHDLRFNVYQSLKWTMVPQWGSFEANFWKGRKALFDSTYNGVTLWGGNSDALLYVRGQRCGADGEVTEESWDFRCTDADLHSYRVGGSKVDIVQRLFEYSPGIGLIFTNPESRRFLVYSRSGRSEIRERERDGRLEFRYSILDGEDPLRYDGNPAIHPHVERGAWLSDQQWAELTYLEHYPDALRRISHSFGSPCAADMHVVASDGWDFAPYYVAKNVLSGSHGSLSEYASLVPIMFHGPGVRTVELPYARTVDIVPTILHYLGVDAEGVDGRVLPIFADDAMNQEVLTQAGSLFAEPQVGDARYAYTLEHFYASYDRRIVRIDRATGERMVLVPSVREACPELCEQTNISLQLEGTEDGKLLLRKTYADQDVVGRVMRFDPVTLRFE